MTDFSKIDGPVIITLTPIEGVPQRIRLQPIDQPDADLCIERQTWRGCYWHTTGVELIERVEISGYQSPIDPNSSLANEEVSRSP